MGASAFRCGCGRNLSVQSCNDSNARRLLRRGHSSVPVRSSFMSTAGTIAAAPLPARHRANPNVQGFVKGAYAAAIGTILGACILLGRIAIGDWLKALIGIASLA